MMSIRSFVDPVGKVWEVSTVVLPTRELVPGHQSALRFTADREVRFLTPAPADWEDCSRLELVGHWSRARQQELAAKA
ncbi:MAG TPA: hypothetical protein VGD77_01030 [Gemmatimonadaceae bacterium]